MISMTMNCHCVFQWEKIHISYYNGISLLHASSLIVWNVANWEHNIETDRYYWQTSNISHTLVGNKLVDHSDVVGAAPTTYTRGFMVVIWIVTSDMSIFGGIPVGENEMKCWD